MKVNKLSSIEGMFCNTSTEGGGKVSTLFLDVRYKASDSYYFGTWG